LNKKVLVACEESQTVTKKLRERGWEAYSADIKYSTGGHPEWHYKGDVTKILNKDWYAILAFPPCTHLTVTGARHFPAKRKDGRQREAIEFFMQFLTSKCPRVCVENPVNIIGGGEYLIDFFPELARKYHLPIPPTQFVQPYEYGDSVTKKTALWLKGLKPLRPTNIVGKGHRLYTPSGSLMSTFHYNSWKDSTHRSKTFDGIATAMVTQWFPDLTKLQ